VTAYRYQAARADGRIITGRLDAPSATQAGATLAEQGLSPIALREAPGRERRPAAARRDLALVFRSIAALAAAGVPLERALLASEPLAKGELRTAIAAARQELHEGRTLAQGLMASDGVVPAVVIGMIRAGERGGRLTRAIDEAAAHLEQEAALVAQVRQALAYPLLLATAGLASVLVIGTVVVPKFAALLGDLGDQLPMATRVLLDGSAFLSAHGVPLAAALVASVAIGTALARQPAGRLRLHHALVRLPVLGPIRHSLASARLTRALAGMLQAGMPLLAALDAARDAAGDAAVAARVASARERVAGGEPLARALEREAALTPMALQLLMVGESSGRLAEMCARAGDLAAGESERSLKTLVTLLEPAMVVFFGGLVAFVAAALLQAVYSIRPGGAL
jgi:type II secretory pathway component PulF